MGKVFGAMGTVAGWCFSLFCFTAVLVYGINIGSVLLLLCGIAALPLKVIRTIWEKVPKKLRRWKAPLLGVLFFTAVLMVPLENREEANSGGNFEPVTITQAATYTPVPTMTNTPVLTATNTPTPTMTNTPVPTATNTPMPTPTQAVAWLTKAPDIDLAEIPAYSGNPYVVINNNEPLFADTSLTTESYEFYSELDELGRCGVTSACIGIDIMPTKERGSIGQVKPTGWHTVKYEIVDGMYLYNRCHLIGFQLTGENVNTRNLITGTRYMNVDGMLPFENMVADYVEETGNHVMYRVTPLFEGDNLVADGVLMEAKSVEDNGEGILFHVFVYNVQPGVEIDYATGESALSAEEQEETTTSAVYVWISATGSKYHNKNNCGNMNPNKAYQLELDEAIRRGYDACKKCY